MIDRPEREVDDGMGAELGEGEDANVRERIGRALIAAAAEDAHVIGSVRHVEGGAVDSHQPPGTVEDTGRAGPKIASWIIRADDHLLKDVHVKDGATCAQAAPYVPCPRSRSKTRGLMKK